MVECRSSNTDGVQAHGIICCGRGRIRLVRVHQRDYAIEGVRDDDDGDSLRTRCSFSTSHFLTRIATKAPGRNEVVRHGANSRGAGVARGGYLFRIVSGSGYTETKRMTLLK
ncbi:MAG: hypothetical protein QGI34_11915 [Candidatus Latescibacteria bacterium]|nr:hypothetical protein [Candidatus Latescibacterota bacterium]